MQRPSREVLTRRRRRGPLRSSRVSARGRSPSFASSAVPARPRRRFHQTSEHPDEATDVGEVKASTNRKSTRSVAAARAEPGAAVVSRLERPWLGPSAQRGTGEAAFSRPLGGALPAPLSRVDRATLLRRTFVPGAVLPRESSAGESAPASSSAKVERMRSSVSGRSPNQNPRLIPTYPPCTSASTCTPASVSPPTVISHASDGAATSRVRPSRWRAWACVLRGPLPRMASI